jgi:putative transposase
LTSAPHRKTIRLQGFDYFADGAYFVTLVTHTCECFFGEIINEEMVLSE